MCVFPPSQQGVSGAVYVELYREYLAVVKTDGVRGCVCGAGVVDSADFPGGRRQTSLLRWFGAEGVGVSLVRPDAGPTVSFASGGAGKLGFRDRDSSVAPRRVGNGFGEIRSDAVPGDSQGTSRCGSGNATDARVDDVSVAAVSSGKLYGPNGGVSMNRGPNYARNAARRAEKKKARQSRSAGDRVIGAPESGRDAGLSTSGWSGCKDADREEYNRSRVQRAIDENKRASMRAKNDILRIEREREDGTFDRRYEVSKRVVEGQLSGRYSLVGGRVAGWAETVVTGSSSPSSSSAVRSAVRSGEGSGSVGMGSSDVSPLSSVSVKSGVNLNEEVTRLRLANEKLIAENAALCERNEYLEGSSCDFY